MAINRWIGQAVAVQEVKYYIPRNVTPGTRFQLQDGVRRIVYKYPSVVPDADMTQLDRANRIVNELVIAANSETEALRGGGDDGLTYEAASFNGEPAVKIVGTSDGAPVGVASTATAPTVTPVTVQQMQVGSSGTNYVFTLTWPNVPSAGTWAIAASGKAPVVVAFDVSAASLQTIIGAFGLPCASVSVTGSHTAGYTVNLVGITQKIDYPPIMFPVVTGTASALTITMVLTEDNSYRFGPDTSGYDVDDGIFNADISTGSLLTYLASPYRMGSVDSSNTSIAAVRLTPAVSYLEGVTMTFTFATLAAYNKFLFMSKWKFAYTWTNMAWDSGSSTYKLTTTVPYADTTTHQKISQFPKYKAGTPEDFNPFRRRYHTRTWTGLTMGAFMFDAGLVGYATVNTRKLPHTNAITTSPGWMLQESTVTLTIADGLGTTWVFSGSKDVEVKHGVIQAATAWDYVAISDGSGADMGVNNNAGYICETLSEPGVISKEILIPALNPDISAYYQFKSGTKSSHYFNGLASVALIQDAAQALWGVANVKAAIAPDGFAARLMFSGSLAETDVDASLVSADGTAVELSVSAEVSTPMKPWVLKYTFTGGVCGGTWKFQDGVSPVTSQQDNPWVTPIPRTPAGILTLLTQVSNGYLGLLRGSDITVETEQVAGGGYIMRSFTLSFPPQANAAFITAETPPFWVGIDTTLLKTSEPVLAEVSHGKTAQVEIQLVTLQNGPTSGNWKLTYNAVDSVSLAWNASAATVQAAITTIAGACAVIGSDGGPYRVRWSANGTKLMMVGSSISLVGAASPTFTSSDGIAGTGPNYYDNADNWSLGVLPANTDVLVFSEGAVACLYGMITAVLPNQIDIYRSYRGAIGLPETRSDGSLETLNRWLSFTGASGTALIVRAGLGDSGEGPSCIRLSVTGRPFDASVLGTTIGGDSKAFAIKGDAITNKLIVTSGDVALGVRPEDVALAASVKLIPGPQGDDVLFSSSSGAQITDLFVGGGVANLGQPPLTGTLIGGSVTANGTGSTSQLDAVNANVRWLSSGTLGQSGIASAVQFGGGYASSSATPVAIRIVSNAHGLASGQRVYMRSYSGVAGIDGKVYAVTVVDANTFDLVASLGYGTLTNYAGLVAWAVERRVVIRNGAVLDFDSEGRNRDIVAPIIVQGSGRVSDSKSTVTDLRLWPEQVEGLEYLGQFIELRRSAR